MANGGGPHSRPKNDKSKGKPQKQTEDNEDETNHKRGVMDDETQTPTAADAPTAEQEERGEAVWVRGEGGEEFLYSRPARQAERT